MGPTNIEWCHFTASPWYGCTKVDELCANCYAADMTEMRFGGKGGFIREAYRKAGFEDWETRPVWGDRATRVLSRDFDKKVKSFNRQAQALKFRPRFFTSLDDWLDDMPAGIINLDGGHDAMIGVVGFYLRSVFESQDLDHLMLTKRPEKWRTRLEAIIEHFGKAGWANAHFVDWLKAWLDGNPPANVWFGYSAGTKETWESRHKIVSEIPARVRWCSAEPMLDPVRLIDIEPVMLDWVVAGYESGPKRRHREIEPLCNLAHECVLRRVKCFVKQDEGLYPGNRGRIPPDVWAIKEFPTPRLN